MTILMAGAQALVAAVTTAGATAATLPLLGAVPLLMIGTTELLLIGGIALLIFGGKKLPELMRGMGQGVRSFNPNMSFELAARCLQPASRLPRAGSKA